MCSISGAWSRPQNPGRKHLQLYSVPPLVHKVYAALTHLHRHIHLPVKQDNSTPLVQCLSVTSHKWEINHMGKDTLQCNHLLLCFQACRVSANLRHTASLQEVAHVPVHSGSNHLIRLKLDHQTITMQHWQAPSFAL